MPASSERINLLPGVATPTPSLRFPLRFPTLLPSLAFFSTLVLALLALLRSERPPAVAAITTSSPGIRHCTFYECELAACPTSAPFLCLPLRIGDDDIDIDDASNMRPATPLGCSTVPWESWSCGDTCSLEHCGSLKGGDEGSKNSCKGAKCGMELCLAEAQGCTKAVPFQCLKGGSAHGCSSDPYRWLSGLKTTCSECCDYQTC